jgi:hypothetical protein
MWSINARQNYKIVSLSQNYNVKDFIIFNFCLHLPGKDGGLAQLARACDWQSQGQGFDSPNLHANNKTVINELYDCLFYF